MSGSSDPAPSKHVIDNLKLEGAIMDVQGDVLLLNLAIEDMGRGEALGIMGEKPIDGYKLYLLTNDQVRAIHYAMNRVLSSADDVATEFWGHDLAHCA